MRDLPVDFPTRELAALAARWRIEELAVFGSVTRKDFHPGSDIDVLVTFGDDAGWNLWDFMELKEQMEQLLGRRVDLVEKRAIRNPYRKQHILRTAKVVYAA